MAGPRGARSGQVDQQAQVPARDARGQVQGDLGLAGIAAGGQQVDLAAGRQVGRAVLPFRIDGRGS